MEDFSLFFGYKTMPSSEAEYLVYFDVDCLLSDMLSTTDIVCPRCMRGAYMKVMSADELGCDETLSDLFDAGLFESEVLYLVCPQCDYEIRPTGLMVKNESTGEIDEYIAE